MLRTAIRSFPVLLVLALAAAAGAEELQLAKNRHLDLADGVAFFPPSGWKGVPPKARSAFEGTQREVREGEDPVVLLAEYRHPTLDQDQARRVCRCVLYRIYRCKNLAEVMALVKDKIRAALPGALFGKETPAGPKAATVEGADETDGRALVWANFGGKTDSFAILYVWRDDPALVALPALAQSSMRSLKLLPAAEVASLRDKNGRAVLLSDWGAHLTENYTIQYNTGKEYAEEAGRHLEAILALYRKTFPVRAGMQFPRFVVKLFHDREGFLRYGGMEGAAAYFSPAQGELVGYKTSAQKEVKLAETGETFALGEGGEETFHIMYHEAYHQYMHVYIGRAGDVEPPSWFNEGMGDYFFGGKFGPDRTSLAIGVNDWRIRTIQEALKQEKHVPMREILRYTQKQYYANAGLCYAEGWSICYFILAWEGAESGRYRQIPQDMLTWLKKTGNLDRTFEQAFKGIDLTRMERQWKEFILSLPSGDR